MKSISNVHPAVNVAFSHWRRLLLCAVAGVALLAPPIAGAAYPEKTVRLIVATAPGTPVDIVTRIVANRMARDLGQAIVVDNKPGAGGIIGAQDLLRSGTDGYTFMTVFMPMTVSASMIANYPFDLRTDFAVVGQTAWSYNVLVTHPTVNARSVSELVALLKARPGKFSYASGSVGTPAHVIAELFKVQTGTFAIHVPYNQFGQAISDLVGGQHQFMFVAIPPVVQFIEQGRLRALAVTGPQRVQSLPQIATMAELGYKDLVVRDWQGFAVKSGTPRDIISRLNASVGVALSDGEVKLALAKLGVDPAGGPPEQFAELIGNELIR